MLSPAPARGIGGRGCGARLPRNTCSRYAAVSHIMSDCFVSDAVTSQVCQVTENTTKQNAAQHAHAPHATSRPPPASVGSDYKFHSYKCRTPAGLGSCSWGWGLPTLGCLCKALPNIEKEPRPTGVWQKGTWELIVFSDCAR